MKVKKILAFLELEANVKECSFNEKPHSYLLCLFYVYQCSVVFFFSFGDEKKRSQ